MTAKEHPDTQFDEMTASLLRREALRRAAHDVNKNSGQGLENVLARISAEMTAEAMTLRTGSTAKTSQSSAVEPIKRPNPQLS